MLIVFFGYPAAGKTHIGKLFAEKYGMYFYDGDTNLPQSMLDALKHLSPITDEMRDGFINDMLESTKELKTIHPNLVVAQTFIKERYRQQFLDAFKDCLFVWVVTDQNVVEQRLYDRRKSEEYLGYGKLMIQRFEEPKIEHMVIYNDGNEEFLKEQMEEVYKKAVSVVSSRT